MYKEKKKRKKNKKNIRTIFSVAMAIGFTIIFAGVGIKIFGLSEKEEKKNDKSFFAFAELDKHMAGFQGENKKQMGQEILEDKEKETGQEISKENPDKITEEEHKIPQNKHENTEENPSNQTIEEAGEQPTENKTGMTESETLEKSQEKESPTSFEETITENGQQTTEESTKETEPITDAPETEKNTGSQGDSLLDIEEVFTNAPEGYFEDALFIGDSRTVGLAEYSGLEGADFFATVGMSVYNLPKQKTDVAGAKNIDIETLLSSHSYGKIYFMLGLNELGYNRQKTVDTYRAWLEYIRQMQPQAVLFIEANLHVTAKKSASDEECRNKDIDEFNNYTKELADNESIFYIDINELFDDDEGNLRADLTYDGVHILAKYYADWGEWLKQKAVIR